MRRVSCRAEAVVLILTVLVSMSALTGCAVNEGAPTAMAPEATPPDDIESAPEAPDEGSEGATESPAEADPFAAADAAISKLKQANIAFNTPDELTVGKAEMVQLLLSMKESVEQLKAAVTAAGKRDGAKIEVSNKMEAKLTGSGFEIKPITPETQAISATSRTEWKWEVEPQTSDAKRLHLTLSAHVLLDGEKIPRVVKTFERTMVVNVNWKTEAYEFATGNWEWLWTVLLVPIGGYALRKRSKGGKGESES